MPLRKELGAMGEGLAKKFLENLGYKIIAQNYKNYFGEMDIIAKEGDFFVFIEVKTRIAGGNWLPEESITRKKQERLIRISNQYLIENKIESENFRIDSVAIEIDRNTNQAKIRHLKNAVKYF